MLFLEIYWVQVRNLLGSKSVAIPITFTWITYKVIIIYYLLILPKNTIYTIENVLDRGYGLTTKKPRECYGVA